MNIDNSQPIVTTSCCKAILYKIRYCYDKVKELAIRLFEYIASIFIFKKQHIANITEPQLSCFSGRLSPIPESPIHIVVDLPSGSNPLSTDALESTSESVELAKTPSSPATPVSISSAVERRLKQESPDTIIREVLESMSATPPGEQRNITVSPSTQSRRVSPTGSIDSWVIDPV